MKKYFYVLVSLVLLSACKKDDVGPPPDKFGYNFKNFLLENFDLDKDGVISFDEADKITEIDCSNMEIRSLLGIEWLPNLEVIIASNCQLHYSGLNATKNPKLHTIICDNNDLESLDLSNNPLLKTLICDNNQLDTLDVSNNPVLELLKCSYGKGIKVFNPSPSIIELDIRGNRLTSLDFNGNKIIRKLWCSGNEMVSLNVSRTNLEELECGGEKLTSMNIDGCTTLKSLTCEGENISIDLSNCANLVTLYANNVQDFEVSRSPLLKTLHCTNSRLINLDLSKNPALEDLRLTGTNFSGTINLNNNYQLITVELGITISQSYFDLSNRKFLKELSSGGRGEWHLESLNLSGCNALETVTIEYENIKTLNVSGCQALSTLRCNSSRLSELILTGCVNLMTLDCAGNNLTELNLIACTKLVNLNCSSNQLTALPVFSTNLTTINCVSNLIAELNFRYNTQLKELFCCDNKLTLLDLTGCTSLVELDCRNNVLLESLILTNCNELKILSCTNCLLTGLNISPCLNLTHLYCAANRLQHSLDASKCTKLKELNCVSNSNLTELILDSNHTINPLHKDTHTQIKLVN